MDANEYEKRLIRLEATPKLLKHWKINEEEGSDAKEDVFDEESDGNKSKKAKKATSQVMAKSHITEKKG